MPADIADFPQNFDEIRFDLEIDLKGNGGLQRFPTVGDFNKWLNDEVAAWQWLKTHPANRIANNLSYLSNQFWVHLDHSRNILNQFNGQWQQARQQHQGIFNRNDDKSRDQQLVAHKEQFSRHLDHTRNEIRSHILSGFVTEKYHLFRGTPEAEFILNLKDSDANVATYALHYLLLNRQDPSREHQIHEPIGRVMAYLYMRGWIPKKEGKRLAYDETVKTWANELGDYKKQYEDLKLHFSQIQETLQTELRNWQVTQENLQKQFLEQKDRNEKDLSNLKDTYDRHMQLQAPMQYWGQKRSDHDTAVVTWRTWCVIGSIAGLLLLALGCFVILPASTQSTQVPWQRLGAFVMFSTVIIWLLRFPFKLLLSHIHLRNDAREREVMISTYMALLRGSDGKQGVTLEDLKLVIAPIFRPATSGIIKDEGGPTSFLEFFLKR